MFDPRTCRIGDFAGYAPLLEERRLVLTDALAWHIIEARPRRTRSAIEELRELGCKPYLPVQHRTVPAGRRRRRQVEEPIYGEHIFVPLPRTVEAFYAVRALRDVADFVMIDDRKPALLSDEVIEIVRQAEARNDRKYRRELAKAVESPYRVGRTVWAEVMMRKILGSIAGRDARGRIEVLLEAEIFGRRVWALVPEQLQFADEL